MAEGNKKKITVVSTRYLTLAHRTCPQCGKSFERMFTAKYCSTRCRNNASYARHAEAYRALRRKRYQAGKKNKQ